MKIYIPKELRTWIKLNNPSEGELLFVSMINILSKLCGGTHVYQEWQSKDIKKILHDTPAFSSITTINKLEKQGVLDIIRGLDGAESLRLASHLEINNMSNLTVKGTDALELKSEQSIIMLSYLLGRLAFVRDNKVEYIIPNKTEVAPKIIKTTKSKSTLHYARKAEKDKKVTEVNIIPTIYMSQLYRMDEKED